MARVALKKVQKSGNEADIKAAQDKLAEAQTAYMTAQTELHAAFQAKKAADFGIEDKEEAKTEDAVQAPTAPTTDTATVDQNNQAVDQAAATATTTVDSTKTVEFTKTNNGNGNGNKSFKEDREKSAHGKSGEEHGKSGQAHGRNK